MDLSINEVKLLKVLKSGPLSPETASMESSLGEKETMSAASWLRSKGLVDISEVSTRFYFANEEGKRYAEQGLPERRAVEWLNQAGDSLLSELPLDDDESKVVIGWLKRKKFADLEKTEEGLKLIPTGNIDETSDEPLLVKLSKDSLSEKEIDQDSLKLLKGRQLLSIKEEIERTFTLTEEGNNFDLESLDDDLIGDLTPDLIQSGEWKDKSFQRYGVETKVEVKGTTSFDPTKLSMTWREVELHQKEKGLTALSIVSSIKLQRGDPPMASSGKIEVLLGWDIEEWSLKPVS